MVQSLGSRQKIIQKESWAGSSAGSRATCPQRRSGRSRTLQVTCLNDWNLYALLSTAELVRTVKMFYDEPLLTNLSLLRTFSEFSSFANAFPKNKLLFNELRYNDFFTLP